MNRDLRHLVGRGVRFLPFLALATGSFAQQSVSSCSIPVVVAAPAYGLVQQLSPGDFEARIDHHVVRVLSAQVDDRPRRIVILLDAGKEVSDAGWSHETTLARSLVAEARDQDRIALGFYGAREEFIDFSIPRPTVSDKLQALASSRPQSPSDNHLYDALLRTLNQLADRQFGDSIVVIASKGDVASQARAGTIKKAMFEHKVRLFSLISGQADLVPAVGVRPVGTAPQALRLVRQEDFEELTRLSEDVGGAIQLNYSIHVEGARQPSAIPKINEGQLLQEQALFTFREIVQTYRLEFALQQSKDPVPLNLALTKSERSKVPQAKALYPHELTDCLFETH